MGIKRYVATKDTTIVNAYNDNLTTRATRANLGASDILEVYSIVGQASSASIETSRILIDFPINDIESDRNAGILPASGSVSYYLKMSNAPHSETTPADFDLIAMPISRSWEEGRGLDMERYRDLGVANWLSASSGVPWTTEGGDYITSSIYTSSFFLGNEDLSVDITPLVESWISGDIASNGIGIMLPSDLESDVSTSYFTKRFFARRSEHFYKRPWIEARFDSAIKDNRNSFYISSSMVPAEDNLMTLSYYNRTRKGLRNIPGIESGPIYMSLYSGTLGPEGPALLLHTNELAITGGAATTGYYTASVALDTTLDRVFDVWHNNLTGSDRKEYFTGSVVLLEEHEGSNNYASNDYVVNITNLKSQYSDDEKTRFRVFARNKNWSPTIYTIAIQEIETEAIENLYYKVFRIIDGFDVVPYLTGSENATLLSYDLEGNYFDFDMSMLESDYQYGIQFLVKDDETYREINSTFKFRVK